jgi:hypothetical protein
MKPLFPSPQGVRPCSDNVQVHVPSRLWDVDGHGSLSMRTNDAGGAGQSGLATYILSNGVKSIGDERGNLGTLCGRRLRHAAVVADQRHELQT